MTYSRSIACLAVIAAAAYLTGDTGVSQSVRRQGGPLDWSHARIVESRRPAGTRLAASATRDWRQYRRQVRTDAAFRRAAGAVVPPTPTGLRILDGPLVVAPHVADPGGSPAHAPGNVELDWSLRTGGYGPVVGYPAKYNFDITASNCSDVDYFTVDQTGSATAVNVIAITNPYAGCSGNATGKTPKVKWGLRLPYGTATSPVPSFDGEVLYVLQSRPSANGGLILHAINVDNIVSNVGSYNFTTNVWSGAHTLGGTTGSAPEQLFQITFAGVTNNTSSPFLDYATNQLFFGDSAGRIHRVANVGSSAAVRDTTNFPVSCGSAALQSPVFVDGQVIVTSADGRLYRIDTTKPAPYTCVASAQAGSGTGAGGGLSAPMIDVTNEKIIVATNHDDNYSLRGVGVFDLLFAANAAPTATALTGLGTTTVAPSSPTFDNDFWTTNDGSLYTGGGPLLWEGTYLVRVPYNAGVFGSSYGYAALARSGAAATVAISPVTEFLTASPTGNPDFIYVGGNGGTYTYLNRISSNFGGSWLSPVSMTSNFLVTGGVSSGISIDTRTTAMTGTTATANVYFGTAPVGTTTMSTIVQLAQAF